MHKTLKYNMLRLAKISLAALLLVSCTQAYEFDYLYKDLTFDMPKVTRPVIPSRTVNLTDFGAVGDGRELNSQAFADAIQALSDKGGGHLIVPQGMWLTGPITLKSNIDLHLEKGAVVIFSPDEDLYPIVNTNFEGTDLRRCLAPLNATGAKNISITGEGIFEGNGDKWREFSKKATPPRVWERITKRGGVFNDEGTRWFPTEGYREARMASGNLNIPDHPIDENYMKRFLRPELLVFTECENVLLEGCTYQNSPCWNLHPLWCRNMIIKDIMVRTADWAVNGDGIDIDGCENVILTGSFFDVGDDGVCIKSGKDADGRRHARACHHLLIDDVTVYHAHGGFTVGSEMSGGVHHIKVSNCRYLGTEVGLRFKSKRGRGGVVSDIWCDNIHMMDIISSAFVFNLYYAATSVADMKRKGIATVESDLQPVDETTPEFRDCHFSRIICNGADESIYVNGLPEMPVSNITFKDCNIKARTGASISHARNVTFDNVTIIPETGEPLTTFDVEGMTIN